MKRFRQIQRITICAALAIAIVGCTFQWLLAAEQSDADLRQAQIAGLKPFQFLVGNWRASSRTRAQTGVEDLTWKWHLKKEEPPAIEMDVKEGAYFENGLLRYDIESERYRFVAQQFVKGSKDKTETVVFEGKLEPSEVDPETKVLSLERRVAGSQARERILMKISKEHHYIFQLEQRPNRTVAYRPRRVYSVTRDGESIAALKKADAGPICFISGGLGTSSMSYKGKTYYFCCSGCSESFKDDPEKWIAEAAKAEKK